MDLVVSRINRDTRGISFGSGMAICTVGSDGDQGSVVAAMGAAGMTLNTITRCGIPRFAVVVDGCPVIGSIGMTGQAGNGGPGAGGSCTVGQSGIAIDAIGGRAEYFIVAGRRTRVAYRASGNSAIAMDVDQHTGAGMTAGTCRILAEIN